MISRPLFPATCLALLLHCSVASAQLALHSGSIGRQAQPNGITSSENTMSFVFREAPVTELFEMLSREARVNIVLSRGVTGSVTVNLYDMTVSQAIHAIAEAAGYHVEERGNGYFISEKKESAIRKPLPELDVRTIRVQYSNPKQIADVAAKYASSDGKVTLLEERRMLIVEDRPEIVARIERLVRSIDWQPKQIMIEAKILEISLDTTESFGVDWNRVFTGDGARIGTQGLSNRNSPGLFFRVINSNIEAHLHALSDKGRVRTLATPKLLTLENHEAVTNVGDKIGYRLTTTINNISTESIQFLDTGVILRVTPSVDADGRIAMRVRPEVSSGSVSGGIPSKKTTEVSTQLVAESGQSILIAGLIKSSESYRRAGVPVLADIPGIGRLFSSTEDLGATTETIVLITPRIVEQAQVPDQQVSVNKTVDSEKAFDLRNNQLKMTLDMLAPRGQ